MADEEGWEAFKLIRLSDTKGEPHCPRCGCFALYTYRPRKLWKCKACNHQFSVTSGTIFASRKLGIRDYLLAIAIFVNGAKGHSALQLSRDLDVQYKTAEPDAVCSASKARRLGGGGGAREIEH